MTDTELQTYILNNFNQFRRVSNEIKISTEFIKDMRGDYSCELFDGVGVDSDARYCHIFPYYGDIDIEEIGTVGHCKDATDSEMIEKARKIIANLGYTLPND